jgi:hypothetical protein
VAPGFGWAFLFGVLVCWAGLISWVESGWLLTAKNCGLEATAAGGKVKGEQHGRDRSCRIEIERS